MITDRLQSGAVGETRRDMVRIIINLKIHFGFS